MSTRFLQLQKINPLKTNFFLLPLNIFKILVLTIKSFIFLKKKKTEVLISTGGYMSLPLCLASRLLNIKLYLFEPNIVIGRSNKLFLRYCKKIFCYSDKIKNFPKNLKNKIEIIPPLLRKKLYELNKTKTINDQIKLLVIGGSQGAKIFDTLVKNSIVKLSKKYKFKVYQQSNINNFTSIKKTYQENKIDYELFEYNEDVSIFMDKSNLCITRAGATTLAELVFLNLPHVAIPLPSSKDNHQFENANFYEQNGCNWIMSQNEINETNLTSKLIHIIQDKKEYLKKKNNMKNFNFQNSWNNVNQKIIDTINEN